jgi:hypothetical protein
VSSTKDLIAVTALTAVVMYLAAGAQSELKMMEKSILKKHWHKKVHSDQGSNFSVDGVDGVDGL